MEIATINSHHSGVPEVAWWVKVDGLVIYHNGDCQPADPSSEHNFLKTKTNAINLAFVFPVTSPGEKYTIQEEDFFKKFQVRVVFPIHVQAGVDMYLDFQKVFQAKFPSLRIHVPMKMGQRFVSRRSSVFGRKTGLGTRPENWIFSDIASALKSPRAGNAFSTSGTDSLRNGSRRNS